MSPVAKLYFEDVHEGMEIGELKKGPIERIQLVKYAGASGDFNPIHVDEEYARSAGYPSVFAHGMLSMGFLGQLLTDWAGVGTLREFSVRFRAITWPKDVITCRGIIKDKRLIDGAHLVELEVWAENQKGEKTVTGSAIVELPSRQG